MKEISINHIEGSSKVGVLTRRILKIFRLEQLIIALDKVRTRAKILRQSCPSQRPIFASLALSGGKFLLALFSLNLCCFFIEGTSASELTNYPEFCQQAATNEAIFRNFKQNPIYRQILEHVSCESGQEYLEGIITESPEFIELFDQFRTNDYIGSPLIYDYKEYGWFSPTTLRYVKVASDIKKSFGDISQMHIAEIGGGYGGQCKILADALGFASYTIIDLPDCTPLTRKYLSLHQIDNASCIDSNNFSALGSYDLVISNYAFSEIDREEQLLYIQYLIKNTPSGYMTMNFMPNDLISMPLKELLEILYQNKRQTRVEREHPNTHPNNLILYWYTTSKES